MEKQNYTNPANHYNAPPVGAGTSTSSGVTVFDPSAMNANQPLPPTYDQAMSNAAPFTATTRTYTAANGWSAPGMGAPNAGYNMPPTHTTTTTYTTYGSSVAPPPQPQPQPPPRRPTPQQAIFAQNSPPPQPPVVIIQQTPIQSLGPEPVYLICPACHIQKLTRIEYEPSSRTHLMAALLCLVGLWCCVCLPYCAGSCMNTHHYCGNCDKFLGTYGNTL